MNQQQTEIILKDDGFSDRVMQHIVRQQRKRQNILLFFMFCGFISSIFILLPLFRNFQSLPLEAFKIEQLLTYGFGFSLVAFIVVIVTREINEEV